MKNTSRLLTGVMLVGTLASCTSTEPVIQSGATSSVLPVGSGSILQNTGSTQTSDVSATFTAKETVSYMSPGGKDAIGFALEVKDGKIVSLAVEQGATSDGSKWAQGEFVKAIPTIIGKPVNALGTKAIGGASLTTAAFEKFVAAALAKNTSK